MYFFFTVTASVFVSDDCYFLRYVADEVPVGRLGANCFPRPAADDDSLDLPAEDLRLSMIEQFPFAESISKTLCTPFALQ